MFVGKEPIQFIHRRVAEERRGIQVNGLLFSAQLCALCASAVKYPARSSPQPTGGAVSVKLARAFSLSDSFARFG